MDKILGLSEQQKACLRLVHRGLRTKEIAPIVQLAPASIDTYIRQAMIQLGTRDRREAARMLVEFEATDGRPVAAPVEAENAAGEATSSIEGAVSDANAAIDDVASDASASIDDAADSANDAVDDVTGKVDDKLA